MKIRRGYCTVGQVLWCPSFNASRYYLLKVPAVIFTVVRLTKYQLSIYLLLLLPNKYNKTHAGHLLVLALGWPLPRNRFLVSSNHDIEQCQQITLKEYVFEVKGGMSPFKKCYQRIY
jgi:hypothetical protein